MEIGSIPATCLNKAPLTYLCIVCLFLGSSYLVNTNAIAIDGTDVINVEVGTLRPIQDY